MEFADLDFDKRRLTIWYLIAKDVHPICQDTLKWKNEEDK